MAWHFYLMAFIYALAGIWHFVKPKMYLKIMPPYFKTPRKLIFWSGVAEVVLALGLLFKTTIIYAIYGIVLMLLAFLPVHIYMLQEDQKKIKVPKWFSIIRLPIQFVLIWWAIYYL